MIEEAGKGARVLLVTRNFPPLRGGMERLNLRLFDGLSRRHVMALSGPAGCGQFVATGTRVAGASTDRLAEFLFRCGISVVRFALQFKPHVVIAGSGLTVPLAWLASRLSKARLVAYLHGLDIIAANPVYRAIWRPWLSRCDLVLVNSRNTARLAREAGVAGARIRVVHPGVDPARPDRDAANQFRSRHALGDATLLLSVGRLTPRKGLAEFVRDVFPGVVERIPDVRLLVMGHDPVQALNRPGRSGLEGLRAAVREGGFEDRVLWLPPCDDRTLSIIYQASDVHVFPVREIAGDVEGFGMVAIEAAANGVPTVAFAVGGVPDAIVPEATGRLVPAGDADAFAAAIVEMVAARRDPRWSMRCREASRPYEWSRFDSEVAAEIDALLGREAADGDQ